MKRYRQTVNELLGALSAIQTSWRDEHSDAVIQLIDVIPNRRTYSPGDVEVLLNRDFAAGLTAIRLILDRSKDEFTAELQAELGPGGTGATRHRRDPARFTTALVTLGVLESLRQIANAPITWRSVTRRAT